MSDAIERALLENQTCARPKPYTLDGVQTTLAEIVEARKRPGVKIVEAAPGEFKTLQRLNG